MSEPLRTYTERTRDQLRIEMLEVELKTCEEALWEQMRETKRQADALEATEEKLEEAREWKAEAALYAISAGFLAVMLLRWVAVPLLRWLS